MRPTRTLIAVALLGLVGCGIDQDVVAREAAESHPASTTPRTDEPGEPEEPVSSPFRLEVPEGYEPWAAGRGEGRPGDARPATVLAPEGDPAARDVVIVELVDAARASFEESGGWATLTLPAQDDVAVRASAVAATRQELEEVAEAVSLPEDPARDAPVVDAPPAGLEVAGTITADGVLGRATPVPEAMGDPVLGPESAHIGVWIACPDGSEGGCGTLVAMTLPGDALDPGVAISEVAPPRQPGDPRRAEGDGVRVGGEAGIVTTTTDAESGRVLRRELAVRTSWGDVLLLVSRSQDILDVEALVEVAESATEITGPEWDDFVADL